MLERVYETFRGLPRALEGFADVRSVVVFGSAVRPEDFVEGVSNVDVLVLAGGEPRERHCTLELGEGLRVEVVVLKPEELVKLAGRAGSSSSWCCALRGRARGFTSSPRAGFLRLKLSEPQVSRALMRGFSP